MRQNLIRDAIQGNTGSGDFYILDEFCKQHFPSLLSFLISIQAVIYSFHMLLNLKVVIQSHFKFLTNFSVDFSLCVSELVEDVEN